MLGKKITQGIVTSLEIAALLLTSIRGVAASPLSNANQQTSERCQLEINSPVVMKPGGIESIVYTSRDGSMIGTQVQVTYYSPSTKEMQIVDTELRKVGNTETRWSDIVLFDPDVFLVRTEYPCSAMGIVGNQANNPSHEVPGTNQSQSIVEPIIPQQAEILPTVLTYYVRGDWTGDGWLVPRGGPGRNYPVSQVHNGELPCNLPLSLITKEGNRSNVKILEGPWQGQIVWVHGDYISTARANCSQWPYYDWDMQKNQPSSPIPNNPLSTVDLSKKVLAFYYAWFCPRQFGCWDPVIGDSPIKGTYDSLDLSVISAHIQEAKSSGIDGFIVSWVGNQPNNPDNNKTNVVLGQLLDVAQQVGDFTIAVDYESLMIQAAGLNHSEQIAYLIQNHARHPTYLRINGLPAVFFWKNEQVSDYTWQQVRNYMNQYAGPAYWIADAGPAEEGIRQMQRGIFDNVHYYSTWWTGAINVQQDMWSSAPNPDFFTVTPGYHGTGRWVGSSMYQQQWNQAIANRNTVDIVLITSWNEWPEGTYIEGGQRFGNTYLHLTAQMASRFKSQ